MNKNIPEIYDEKIEKHTTSINDLEVKENGGV